MSDTTYTYVNTKGEPITQDEYWRGHLKQAADWAKAVKHDAEKPRLDLIPSSALEAAGRVLGIGAKKYTDHNWRKGFNWSRLMGAALRHLTAFNDGQDKDPETQESHLAHALCCVMFLVEHEAKKLGTDDRYKGEAK